MTAMAGRDLERALDVDFSAHEFPEALNTHGVKSYRSGWTKFYKHEGILVGFTSLGFRLLISSDPYAKWERGCREGSNGNPMPYSKTARSISLSDLPPRARDLAMRWAKEAIQKIKREIWAEKGRNARKTLEALRKEQQKHKEEVVKPWMDAVAADQLNHGVLAEMEDLPSRDYTLMGIFQNAKNAAEQKA